MASLLLLGGGGRRSTLSATRSSRWSARRSTTRA